jgi:hypothetical protein
MAVVKLDSKNVDMKWLSRKRNGRFGNLLATLRFMEHPCIALLTLLGNDEILSFQDFQSTHLWLHIHGHLKVPTRKSSNVIYHGRHMFSSAF